MSVCRLLPAPPLLFRRWPAPYVWRSSAWSRECWKKNLRRVISVVTPAWQQTGRLTLPGLERAGCTSREKSFSGCPLEWEWQDSPGEQTSYCGNFSFLRESIGMPRPRPHLGGGLTPQDRWVITGSVNSVSVEARGGGAATQPFLPPVHLVYASLTDPRRPGHHYRLPLAPTSLGANLPPADSRPSSPVKEPEPERSGARLQYQCVVVNLEFTIK